LNLAKILEILSIKSLVIFVLIFSYFPLQAKNYRVRVLLAEQRVGDSPWNISTPEGFRLIDPTNRKEKAYSQTIMKISLKKKDIPYIYLNSNCYLKDKIYLVPRTDYLSFNGKNYHGSFLLIKEKDKLLLINCVDLEDYLCGVIQKESWPGWPLEVNKVFAIASRSYVLSMTLDAKATKRCYDVRDTNKHQTYGGLHTNQEIRKAVDQTRGVYLSYDGKPIVAMFDACCGGIIPARIDTINVAYLARDYPCTYCKTCKQYQWQAELTIKDFEKQIKKSHKSVKQLHNCTIQKRDRAGLVKEVLIKGKPKDIALPVQKLYSMFDQIKSYCFHILKRGTKFIIKGRGRGHHRGLCQWGAYEMVKGGWGDYQAILQFYYPGTTFTKLV
jgi:stage II sporulation protein D